MDPKDLLCTILSTVLLTITIVFNIIVSTESFISEEIFQTKLIDLNTLYLLDFIPSSWVYAGLLFIGIFLLTWHIYALYSFCKFNEYSIRIPPMVPYSVYCIFIIVCILNLGFLFAQDRMHMWLSMCIMLLTTITLFSALFIGLQYLTNTDTIQSKKHDYFIIATTYNGLAALMVWTYFMTIVFFGIAIDKSASADNLSFIMISLLLIGVFLFYILDFILAKKYTSYLLLPHVTILWLTAAIYSNHHHLGHAKISGVSQYLIVFLVFAILVLLCKFLYILIDIIRRKENSLDYLYYPSFKYPEPIKRKFKKQKLLKRDQLSSLDSD